MAKNKNSTKKSTVQESFLENKLFWIGGIFVVILLTVVVMKEQSNQPQEEGIYPIPTQTPTPLSTQDRGGSWKEYLSNEHGFSIALPSSSQIELDNSRRSELDPLDTEIHIRDEYGNIQVQLEVIKYDAGDNFYDLIEELSVKENYSTPTEVYVNSAKGVYVRRDTSDGFSSVGYFFPHTTETYIRVTYTALKREVDANMSKLIEEQIVRSFNFI